MTAIFRPALASLLLLSLLTGVIYPLAVTGLSAVIFPGRAGGSVLKVDGRAVGSELIGQPFDDPKYFWGRPSVTASVPYNGVASGGSNLSTGSTVLREAVDRRAAALRAADPDNRAPVPVDLVTASGSGLDPHVSVAAARYQAGRVARVRGLAPDTVERLIETCTARRTLGVLGEPRVNVLELNLALDGHPTARPPRTAAAVPRSRWPMSTH